MATTLHYFEAEKLTTTDRLFEGYIVPRDETYEKIASFKLPTDMNQLNQKIIETFEIPETSSTFSCFRMALTGAAISRFYGNYTEYTSEHQQSYFPYLAYILLKLKNADCEHLQRAQKKLLNVTEFIFKNYEGKAKKLVQQVTEELQKMGA